MYRARLPTKPSAELSYSITYTASSSPPPTTPPPPRLTIFLNNLLLPAASWTPTLQLLTRTRPPSHNPLPLITYDRFSQGQTTDADPSDALPTAEPGYGHDFTSVVSDLHALITSTLVPTLYPCSPRSTRPSLLLIGASIGAPIARLYAQTYPGEVSGVIFLDSNLANKNYTELFPDPDAVGFDEGDVIADDCTLRQFLEAREGMGRMFDLGVRNGEGLDRRNSVRLLPFADGPVLYGPGEEEEGRREKTKVMVVGHDPEVFAQEGLERMGWPRSVTRRWVQSAWDEYNEGLLRVGDSEGVNGGKVKIAKGCGHFVQKDDPGFVAECVGEMLDVLGW